MPSVKKNNRRDWEGEGVKFARKKGRKGFPEEAQQRYSKSVEWEAMPFYLHVVCHATTRDHQGVPARGFLVQQSSGCWCGCSKFVKLALFKTMMDKKARFRREALLYSGLIIENPGRLAPISFRRVAIPPTNPPHSRGTPRRDRM
jgi:hypothetical protein